MAHTAEGGVVAPSDAASVLEGSEDTPFAAASGVEAAGAPSPQVPDACDPEEPTPEELAEIHAHNAWVRALDAALTDIRQRSYEGKLTTMARWRKRSVAPEGMSAQEFEQKFAAYLDELDAAARRMLDATSCFRCHSFALQFLCRNEPDWTILPPQLDDVADLPTFLPKDAAYWQNGLTHLDGYAIHLVRTLRNIKEKGYAS